MRLAILPGMGATDEMYSGAWRELRDATFLHWPRYDAETTLADVAQRVIAEVDLASTEVLAGSSLGGMVALEIAARIDAKAVCLIGSAARPEVINPVLRKAARLASPIPVKALQCCGAFRSPVVKMFRESDARFVAAMCSAVARWRGSEYKGPLLRIHGERDRVIPPPKDSRIIPNAGHLLAITHARPCVEALLELLENIDGAN